MAQFGRIFFDMSLFIKREETGKKGERGRERKATYTHIYIHRKGGREGERERCRQIDRQTGRK